MSVTPTPVRLLCRAGFCVRPSAAPCAVGQRWQRLFFGGGGTRGGGGGVTPTGWPHTAQSGERGCGGPEPEPYQRDTLNTPIPGGAQCPDQNSMGVEPTRSD